MTTTAPAHRRVLPALAAATLLASPLSVPDRAALAQNAGNAGSGAERPAQPARATTGAVKLTDRPVIVPGLGLRIFLPEGARYETTAMAGAGGFTMTSEDNSWRMILHDETSRDTSLTVTDVADHLLKELQATRQIRRPGEREAIGSAIEVIDRTPALTINDQPASRFYIKAPATGADVISGYTVFQVEPGRFAIFQMDTLPPSFDRARAAYETILGAAEFRDATEVAAERAAGVKAGDALLESLNREKIEAILPFETWHRIYRPASTGSRADATELGYQRVEARIGRRGELNPDRPKRRWTITDREEGFLVRLTGRVLEGNRIVDADSFFFLSFDRSQEAWAVRMAVRVGDEARGWTETGVRRNGEIEIVIDQPASSPIRKQWREPPQAYLSQVGGFLLPRLLVHEGVPGIYNFYRYQSSLAEIALRRDILELVDDEAAAMWRLRSRTDENAAEDTTLLRKDGSLLRRTKSGGVVTEPVALDELKSLWKSKGLPLQ